MTHKPAPPSAALRINTCSPYVARTAGADQLSDARLRARSQDRQSPEDGPIVNKGQDHCDTPLIARKWLRIALVFVPVLVIGVAGALPHLFFARDLGAAKLFEGAWDESFYLLAISGKAAAWNEYPLRAVLRLLLSASGGPGFRFALASDVALPILVTAAAGFLALMLTRAWMPVIPLTFLLVFASDILALNCSAIYPASITLTSTLRTMPLGLRQFIPDAFSPFLYVYRTPEPQLSLPIFFCHLALLVRFLRLPRPASLNWMAIAASTFICTTIYVFLAAASLFATALATCTLIIVGRRNLAAGLCAILIAATILLGSLVMHSSSGEAQAMLFQSRLPMIAPSMIYGGLFVLTLACKPTHPHRQSLKVFGVLCLLVPFATLNQQVISGWMLQTLNWERYVNYPFVVIGLILILTSSRWWIFQQNSSALVAFNNWLSTKLWAPCAITPRSVICVLLLLLSIGYLYSAQLQTYRGFVYYNLRVTAYADLLNRIDLSETTRPSLITLDDPSLDAQVLVRSQAPDLIFRGYTDLVLAMKTPASGPGTTSVRDRLAVRREWGFMHATRLNFSRHDYEAELLHEIDNQTCWPHLMFHISFLECAPYVSDLRLYSPTRLRALVPRIGEEYERYRQAPAPEDALVISAEPLTPSGDPGVGRLEWLASSRIVKASGFAPALSVEAQAYLWHSAKHEAGSAAFRTPGLAAGVSGEEKPSISLRSVR